jgi:hypothetical protein
MSDTDLENRVGRLEKALAAFSEELRLAYRYVQTDAGSSLTKSRIILEKLVLQTYKSEMGKEPRKPLLGEMLADNQFTRKIERRIVSRMNNIRDLGNLGPHGERVEACDAARALDDLCEVLDWHLDRYSCSKTAKVAGPRDEHPLDADSNPASPRGQIVPSSAGKLTRSLVEYIFVDQPRLQGYLEQLGLPDSGGKHSPDRPLATHEGAVRFSRYLLRNNLAAPYRPRNPFEQEIHDKRFRIETMAARRAQLPLKPGASTLPVLNIWVSLHPDDAATEYHHPPGTLFLIEDYQGQRDHPMTVSGFSSLLLFAYSLAEVPTYKEFLTASGAFRAEAEVKRRFAQDPIGSLSTLGAQFGAERRIRAIYRVRASCVDIEGDHGSVVTIGYPIVIEEA